jgi:hypothetical protein
VLPKKTDAEWQEKKKAETDASARERLAETAGVEGESERKLEERSRRPPHTETRA